MKKSGVFVAGGLVTSLIAGSLTLTGTGTAAEGRGEFKLARFIPSDVYYFKSSRNNPERAFLDRYWGETLTALAQSGVIEDVARLVGPIQHADQLAERVTALWTSVDWLQLAKNEMTFAARLDPATEFPRNQPVVLSPDMVWLFRSTTEDAARCYQELGTVLDGLAREVNHVLETTLLVVEEEIHEGAKGVRVRASVTDAPMPSLPIRVTLRNDIVVISLREELCRDVLALMNGTGEKQTLGNDARFQGAVHQLPKGGDTIEFFDMQALLTPLHATVNTAIDFIEGPRDVYTRAKMTHDTGRLNSLALAAYRKGDVKEALARVREAYDIDPQNSIILYNLACFTALSGSRNEALDWLEQAVEGGFYAPKKIAADPDLKSLRDEPRYRAALAQARAKAQAWHVDDVVINSTRSGEAYRLRMQAGKAYDEPDLEQGLRIMEQACAVAPSDARVLYDRACFHALLGHQEKALHFLEAAVRGGFYCPNHLEKDSDLESLRGHERFEAAKRDARERAARLSTGNTTLARRLVGRAVEAVGILDYTASTTHTEGYSVREDSVTALVSDAEKRPFYAVVGKNKPLASFDRFLPRQTESFCVSAGFHPGALWRYIEESLHDAGLRGEQLLAEWSDFQKRVGISVDGSDFDWVAGPCISVTLKDDEGSVFLMEVTNEATATEKVRGAIQFLSKKLPQATVRAAAKSPPLAGLAMLTVRSAPLDRGDLPGFESLHVAMSPQSLVWGVAQGHLILGTSADAVSLCLATAKGEHPSVRDNARVMAEAIVPTEPFTSVTLTDRRGLSQELSAGLGMATMLSGVVGGTVRDPEVRRVVQGLAGIFAKLVPVVHRVDFHKSKARHTTYNGRAWRSRGVTHYAAPNERPSARQ